MKNEQHDATLLFDDSDDRCDLDPNKICDNCCNCLEMEDKKYRTVFADFLLKDDGDGDEPTDETEEADDTDDSDEPYEPYTPTPEEIEEGFVPDGTVWHGDYSTLPARGRRKRR